MVIDIKQLVKFAKENCIGIQLQIHGINKLRILLELSWNSKWNSCLNPAESAGTYG